MIYTLPKEIESIIDRLEQSGFEAYAVGGCVRDIIMGRTPKDYDVATSALPEQVKECFGDLKVIETGIKHGTVTVVSGGGNVEVTTFRTDGEYSDHRRPDSVSFSSRIEDDLARRDFTINAMAYNPKKGLVDLYGGQEDMFLKRLACVGEPRERFGEDALRIMRALRFASELGFNIESKTAGAIHEMKELLDKISAERISRELVLLLCGVNTFKVLTEFSDVLAVIIPEIKPCIGFAQRNKYHAYDVWTHIAAAVGNSKPQPDVRLALMLHDISKPLCFKSDDEGNGHFYGHEKLSAEMSETILRRLRFPSDTVSRVTRLVRYHYASPVDDERVVKKLLSALGEEDFFLLTEVMKGDNLAKKDFCIERVHVVEAMEKTAERLIAEKQCFKLSDLAVNGNDVAELGYNGREIGAALEKLLNGVIDGKLVNERNALLEYARENGKKQ